MVIVILGMNDGTTDYITSLYTPRVTQVTKTHCGSVQSNHLGPTVLIQSMEDLINHGASVRITHSGAHCVTDD